MAFPDTLLPIKVELDLGGTWTDITTYVYERDDIVITRGRSEYSSSVDPGRLSLTLDNRDGRFSWRKPDGPYYGLIGRNTPIRVSVEQGDTYMEVRGEAVAGGSGVTTPDSAALDITGDIDIRFEGTLDNWITRDDTTELCGKGATSGDQRSWLLMMRTGRILYEWSEAGTSTLSATSTETPRVPGTGRMAIRVVHDVNNGAGGNTVTFYTSDSIDGTWTQLGDPVTASGTTSIFASTAILRVGEGWLDVGFPCAKGKVHAFQLRNSVGTIVADIDFANETAGASSFTGDDGLTWTVGNDTELTNRNVRFFGEVSSWPIRWDTGGFDVYVPIEASGILRRMQSAATPLESSIRRSIQSRSPIGYWPMEERGEATTASSPEPDVKPAIATGYVWESDTSLISSNALPVLDSTGSTGLADFAGPVLSTTSTTWSVSWLHRNNATHGTLFTYMRIITNGTGEQFYIQINNTTTRIRIVGDDNTLVQQVDLATGSFMFNQWLWIKFAATQNGGNVDWTILAVDIGGDALVDGDSFAGTIGRVTSVASPPDGYSATLDGASFGHISVWDSDETDAYLGAVDAWVGELAGDRILRLCDEETFPIVFRSVHADTVLMGGQRPDTLLEIIQEAADADHGMLYEHRDSTSLVFRDRVSLYDQPVRLSLDYEGSDGLVVPIDPVDDDRFIANDVEVSLPRGASGYAVETEGPMSVNDPPDGVGRYKSSTELNLYPDSAAGIHAGWVLHEGTWDESRYPSISVLPQAAPSMIEAATLVDTGDRIQVTNPPEWLPPETIDLMVTGYTELLHQLRWEFKYTCVPYGPWKTTYVAEVDPDDDQTIVRADTAGCELAEALDTTETAVDVLTTATYRWVDSATYADDFPFDVAVGGERMTVTALTGAVEDAFGRTESDTWGSADVGGAWTVTGGSATDYDVGSGIGTHTMTSVNVSRRSTIDQITADVDLQVDIATSALATGASQTVGLMARHADGNNLYQSRLEFTTSNTIILSLRRRVSGVETELDTLTTALTHVAGTFYRTRLQVVGSTIRAKVWAVSGEEPDFWQLSETDTSLTAAGALGVRSILVTGNTNVNPVMRFDNFHCLNPQTMTVTRSVNGVVKSHADGDDIRLADRPIAAL